MRLALAARAKGDEEAAARLDARAFEIFEKISPLKKTDPESLAVYGLIPIQQPADIYEGWGHGGRGGWSWYTGSAARMLSAAYALFGIEQEAAGSRARRPVRAEGGTAGSVAAYRRVGLGPRTTPQRANPPELSIFLVATAAIACRLWLKPLQNGRCVAARPRFWQEAPTNEPRETARGPPTGLCAMLLGLIIVCGLLSIVYGVYTVISLMSADAGSQRMQEISGGGARGRAGLSQAPIYDHRRRRRRRLHRARASVVVDGGDRLRDRRNPLGRGRLHRHERLGARQRAHRAGCDQVARRRPRHRFPLGRGDRPSGGGSRASGRRRLFRLPHRPSRLCAVGSNHDRRAGRARLRRLAHLDLRPTRGRHLHQGR